MRFTTSIALGLSVLFTNPVLPGDAAAMLGTGLSMSTMQQAGDHTEHTLAGTAVGTADLTGQALATGDFNGDGYDDLVVGVPGESESDTRAGEAHLLIGGEDGLRWWTRLNTAPGRDDDFGTAFAVGDFNDDGYDDLAVGEPGWNNDRGSVDIFYGWSFTLTYANTVRGPTTARRFGETLVAGDFDKNGVDDLGIGAPGNFWGIPRYPMPQHPQWLPLAGSVWVLWEGGIDPSDDTPERVYEGGIGHRAGIALAAPPDGLAIGTGSGNVRVLRSLGSPSSNYWYQHATLGSHDGWGSELVTGSFECMGPILAVAAPRADRHPFAQGDGHLFPDAGSITLKGRYGPQYVNPEDYLHPDDVDELPWSRWGQVLAAGDFDRNGCDDLVLGLPRVNPRHDVPNDVSGSSTYRAGEVRILFSERRYMRHWLYGFVLRGSLDLDEVVLSRRAGHGPQPNGTIHYRLHENAVRRAELGSAVAAGDFDGDGFDDLAIGIPRDPVGSVTRAGSVQVVYGGSEYDEGHGRNRPHFARHETWRQR